MIQFSSWNHFQKVTFKKSHLKVLWLFQHELESYLINQSSTCSWCAAVLGWELSAPCWKLTNLSLFLKYPAFKRPEYKAKTQIKLTRHCNYFTCYITCNAEKEKLPLVFSSLVSLILSQGSEKIHVSARGQDTKINHKTRKMRARLSIP